jgi:hypothetical protein
MFAPGDALDMGDETARRRIGLRRQRRIACQRGNQRTRERYPQLDAPLIERIRTEQHGFDKCPVFVQCQQLAEAACIELRHENGRRRAITGADTRSHCRILLGDRVALRRKLATNSGGIRPTNAPVTAQCVGDEQL